jgi:glycosyltransferase involved in cell wall biosynthesis
MTSQVPSVRDRPTLISVIVPVRNCEAHIGEQLAALAGQSYRGAWELVVVDGGCRDRSIGIVEAFRDRLPSLVVVDAGRQRGLNRARNVGASAACGELIAFCDADDVAAPTWLAALADAAGLGDIVGGSNDFEVLNSDLSRAPSQKRPMTSLNSAYGFLPYPAGGNCAIWADVANAIRWDESFVYGASDIEFGWRVQIAGHPLVFAPGAVMHVRVRRGSAAIVRQSFRRGVSEPHLFRCFRKRGMQRDLTRSFRNWAWLARNLPFLLGAADDRGSWLRLAGVCAGRIYGSIRWLTLFP